MPPPFLVKVFQYVSAGRNHMPASEYSRARRCAPGGTMGCPSKVINLVVPWPRTVVWSTQHVASSGTTLYVSFRLMGITGRLEFRFYGALCYPPRRPFGTLTV